MPARNKYTFIVFVFVFLFASGLFIYFSLLTKNDGFDIENLRLPFITNNSYQDKVEIDSEIEGVEVKLSDIDKLKQILDEVGVWEMGMPISYQDRSIVIPRSIKFVVIEKEQFGLKRARDNTDTEAGVASSSLGFNYDDSSRKTTIVMHYAPEYRARISRDDFKIAISEDLIYYPFLLAGDRVGENSFRDIYPQVKSLIDKYLSNNSGFVDINETN